MSSSVSEASGVSGESSCAAVSSGASSVSSLSCADGVRNAPDGLAREDTTDRPGENRMDETDIDAAGDLAADRSKAEKNFCCCTGSS